MKKLILSLLISSSLVAFACDDYKNIAKELREVDFELNVLNKMISATKEKNKKIELGKMLIEKIDKSIMNHRHLFLEHELEYETSYEYYENLSFQKGVMTQFIYSNE